jgi:hypothetical protein
MCIINIGIGDYTYWRYLIWCIFHLVKTTWLDWWHGEFPCEHPPYMSIVFIVGCLEALSNTFSSLSHIYYNIEIDSNIPIIHYLHIYIYNLEISSFYHWEHIQIWWCSWECVVVTSSSLLWVSTLVHSFFSTINLSV